MIQHRKELDDYLADRGSLTLPDDFEVISEKTPDSAKVWFFKYGVSEYLCQQYRFGYSKALGRNVMPVWNDHEQLIAVQSRAIYEGQKPKYLNKTGGDKNPVFRSDDRLMLGHPVADVVVITEDILSAVRVGRLCSSLSTMGTHLSDKTALTLCSGVSQGVYIWYDGDEAGVKGARKAKKTLDLLGVSARIIQTAKDPKEYNNEQIKYILENEDAML